MIMDSLLGNKSHNIIIWNSQLYGHNNIFI